MSVRECPRCHASEDAKIQRLVAFSVRNEVEGETRRVYCPHYQKSAVTPAAYEISRNMDDVFKDKFSCAYCPFRIVEQPGGFFCLYGTIDRNARNLYYLEPIMDTASSQSTHRLSISYWTCSNCGSMIEESRSEDTL